MSLRSGLLVVTALAVLAGAAWLGRDEPWLRAWTARASSVAGSAAKPAPAASLRKCLRANGEVLYTDEACPSGTRAQTVGGQLTVVPGQPAPPAAAASLPNARDVLLKPDAVDIKAKRMDEIIGK